MTDVMPVDLGFLLLVLALIAPIGLIALAARIIDRTRRK